VEYYDHKRDNTTNGGIFISARVSRYQKKHSPTHQMGKARREISQRDNHWHWHRKSHCRESHGMDSVCHVVIQTCQTLMFVWKITPKYRKLSKKYYKQVKQWQTEALFKVTRHLRVSWYQYTAPHQNMKYNSIVKMATFCNIATDNCKRLPNI